MSAQWVPCPNGGKCGSATHDPAKSAYQECLRVSRGGAPASPAAALPPQPSATGGHWHKYRTKRSEYVSMITGLERASEQAVKSLNGAEVGDLRDVRDRAEQTMLHDSDGSAWDDYCYGIDVQGDAARDSHDGALHEGTGIVAANDALLAVAARNTDRGISDDDFDVLTRPWREAGLYLPGSTSPTDRERSAIERLGLDAKFSTPKAEEEFESIWNGSSADGYSQQMFLDEQKRISELLARAGTPEAPMQSWEAEQLRAQQTNVSNALNTRGRSHSSNRRAVEDIIAGANLD